MDAQEPAFQLRRSGNRSRPVSLRGAASIIWDESGSAGPNVILQVEWRKRVHKVVERLANAPYVELVAVFTEINEIIGSPAEAGPVYLYEDGALNFLITIGSSQEIEIIYITPFYQLLKVISRGQPH